MQPTFSEVLDKWHKKFSDMKPGDKIDIQVVGRRDPELFTAICKDYIDRGNYDYELSNDYRYFKRISKY